MNYSCPKIEDCLKNTINKLLCNLKIIIELYPKNPMIMKFLISLSMLIASTCYIKAQDTIVATFEPAWILKCYPNPTSDLLIISSNTEIKEVTLIDLNGQVIKAPALPNWCYSLHDLPNGWIFVYVENKNGEIEKRNVYKN